MNRHNSREPSSIVTPVPDQLTRDPLRYKSVALITVKDSHALIQPNIVTKVLSQCEDNLSARRHKNKMEL